MSDTDEVKQYVELRNHGVDAMLAAQSVPITHARANDIVALGVALGNTLFGPDLTTEQSIKIMLAIKAAWLAGIEARGFIGYG